MLGAGPVGHLPTTDRPQGNGRKATGDNYRRIQGTSKVKVIPNNQEKSVPVNRSRLKEEVFGKRGEFCVSQLWSYNDVSSWRLCNEASCVILTRQVWMRKQIP